MELLAGKAKKKKKKRLTFSDRCSIFQSNYVIGSKSKEEEKSKKLPVGLLGGIKKSGKERLFDKIINNINENERNEKWNELIEYWDSWKNNRDINMEEFNDLQRFEWDKYNNDINNVSQTIDKLIETLKPIDGNWKQAKKDKERIDKLRDISKRIDMEDWLITYKERSDIDFDGGSFLCKSIMGNDLHDEHLKRTIAINNLPFSKWEWEHVVFWIQKIDEFKTFASVFSEWKINGEELLEMNVKQIMWLTDCCYRQEKINKEIVKDLIIKIKKQMINTIITYQYGLYYKVIKQYSSDISELLKYLYPKTEQGPKALWKLDAFYFSKIDNLLAIFAAPQECQ
eukprot:300777_1